MACALKLLIQKGGKMKLMKEILNHLLTGTKNKSGLYGSLPGHYQMAILTIKYK
jgi:hypothetical protein